MLIEAGRLDQAEALLLEAYALDVSRLPVYSDIAPLRKIVKGLIRICQERGDEEALEKWRAELEKYSWTEGIQWAQLIQDHDED
jgi:hypothetical protein